MVSSPTLAKAARVAVVAAAILGGCSTIQVTTDYDRSVRFDTLSSYAWVAKPGTERTDPLVASTLLDSRIRAAVESELAKRGYRPVTGGTPDFLVAYQAALDQKIDASSMRRGPGRSRGYVEPITRTYDEGTLLIDVLEPGSQRLLWRGVGRAEVHRLSDPAKREERLRQAVAKILERFPPE